MTMAATRRGFWLRQLQLWHWVSAALSLAGLLLFAVTGLTLNHAALIPARTERVEQVLPLPAEIGAALATFPEETTAPLPDPVARWLRHSLRIETAGRPTETTDDEIFIPLPVPGGDASLLIDRIDGVAIHERVDRGWIAYLNDLHKGRETGALWGWFIDILAVATIIFALSGLGLLWMHGRTRPATWPLTWASALVPLLIVLMFIH